MDPYFLLLTNLSATAAQAARCAAVLGSPLHVHLALLHLYQDAELDPALLPITTTPAYRSPAGAAAALRALAERLAAQAEVAVTTAPLPEALAGAVHRYHPLLLGMGLRHEHHLLDHLLHNQALPALRATYRPLLLVPEAIPRPCVPRRVLLATDAEPCVPSPTTRRLAPLLAAWPAAYTVVHVADRPTPEPFPGQRALTQVRWSGLLPAGASLALHEARHADPAAGILAAIEATRPDLLVLPVRPRSFLGRLFHRSVTAQVLATCPVPVLLLPTTPDEPPSRFAG